MRKLKNQKEEKFENIFKDMSELMYQHPSEEIELLAEELLNIASYNDVIENKIKHIKRLSELKNIVN